MVVLNLCEMTCLFAKKLNINYTFSFVQKKFYQNGYQTLEQIFEGHVS